MESHTLNSSEAKLIASILAGDTQLYHELIRPYERSVNMMALSYMKNEADAEDVAQEAFFRAFRHLSTFRAEAKWPNPARRSPSWEFESLFMERRGRTTQPRCSG
jgi:RNA polymerase sigma-70 factor (ECF subfamily)